MIRKIVSGGQTGVDRAALDFAIESGIPYGGYAPLGGRAEDFPSPPGLLAIYPEMREHTSREWAPRTIANIKKSDATLIVLPSDGLIGPGTKLTIRTAENLAKPILIVNLGDQSDSPAHWLAQFSEPIALNVAGSRESSHPGIYDQTRAFLRAFLVDYLI